MSKSGASNDTPNREDRKHLPASDLEPPAKRARTAHTDTPMTENGTSANGTLEVCNGSNGATAYEDQLIGTHQKMSRAEFIRLIEQALFRLGYSNVARSLETQSGVNCEAPAVWELRNAVTNADWGAAVALVDSLSFESSENRRQAKFLIYEQQYLEALQRQDYKAAVACLRASLAPLEVETRRLHHLASCILCNSEEELRTYTAWPGPEGGSRQQLLTSLQTVVPPDVILPEARLEVLVEQAIDAQLGHCKFHNACQEPVSLLTDYQCSLELIPSRIVQVLMEHKDEVWHLQFSHNGTMLASASADTTAIIWDVAMGAAQSHVPPDKRVTKRMVLAGHTREIAFLAWSPDDKLLATCGADNVLKLWDTRPTASGSGQCLRTFSDHTSQVTAVAWLPDSRRLVTGSNDKQLLLHDVDGRQLRSWKGQRVNDLAVAPDGRRLVSISNGRSVRIYDLEEDSGVEIAESESIISMALATDGRALLLNLANQAIHLWDLPAEPGQPLPSEPSNIYRGLQQKDGRFVVRSCFGGQHQSYVLSGSEECKVYVWHRATGELLAALEGHKGTVNAVSWNPVDHHMFASASDDKSIRIWGLTGSPPPRPRPSMLQ